MAAREPMTVEYCILTHPGLREEVRLLLDALAAELQSLGADVRISPNGVPDVGGPRTVFLMPDPPDLGGLVGSDMLHEPSVAGRTIVVLARRLPHGVDLGWLGRSAAQFCVIGSAVDTLTRAGLPARRLRLGHTPTWDGSDGAGERDVDRDVDVVLRGRTSARAGATLSRCAPVLVGRPVSLTFDDGATPMLDDPHPPVFSSLDRARLSLQLQDGMGPGDGFDWLAAALAMHRGALVVADEVDDDEFDPADRPFVLTAPTEIPAALADLLGDDEHRRSLASAAHRWLRAHPLAASVRELHAEAGRLLGRAVPDVSRFAVGRGGTRDLVPAAQSDSRDASVIRSILKEIRLDLLDLRRDQARLWLHLTAPGDDAAEEPRVAWRAPAHERIPTDGVRVSVITALHQHAEHVGAAIASVASTGRSDVEIVVVDDGSTDGSGEAVIAAATAHPQLPLLLVRHPLNRGLGQARNTALAHARGDIVFVLDADNEVLPDGLDRLVAALDDDPGASAAFGLLQRFDATGPTGIMGALPWWPDRFRAGNYIDAMAAIRTDALRSLGGYTTDRRLYGWEDYDVWCGLAATGRRAARVPAFVARYRASGTSMVSMSNYSHRAGFVALIERHPTLMGGVEPPL